MAVSARGTRLAAIGATVAVLSAHPARSDAPAPAPGSGAYAPIRFVGLSYDFFRQDRIAAGVGLYFAPDGRDPDASAQAIVIDYFDPTDEQGHAISARDVADAMERKVEQRGGKIIAPFAVPDPASPGQYRYFVTAYYIYPKDGNGDVWISSVAGAGGRVVGILYKQRIDGADPGSIEANIKSWLARNIDTYGGAVSNLTGPAARPADAH